MNLDKRLSAAAELVKHGSRVADIGADHGYLSIYLASVGRASKVFACDLRQKPLLNAKKNIAAAGLENVIETVLADGLDGIDPQEVDTVIIAGMGGEVIASIIERAPWLRSRDYSLILQPMSSSAELRAFLFKNGFWIESENAVRSEGRIYTLIKAVFAPEKAEKCGGYIDVCFGGLFRDPTPENIAYIKWVIKILKKQISALEGVERMSDRRNEICRVVAAAEKELKKAEERAKTL